MQNANEVRLLPTKFLLRFRQKDFVRFVEKAGDNDELEISRIITDYFAAINGHDPKHMFTHFSSDARINSIIPIQADMTPSQYLHFLEKGIHKTLGAYFDDVWVEFDEERTQASAYGMVSVFRSGDWKTRVSGKLTFHFRRCDDGWQVVLLNGEES